MRRLVLVMMLILGMYGALARLPVASASSAVDRSMALASVGTGKLDLLWTEGRTPRLLGQRFADGGWAASTVVDATPAVRHAVGLGAAADPGTGRLLVAMVAGDRLFVRTRDGDVWSGWQPLDGSAVGAPAVASLGDGAFAVVVRDRRNAGQARFLRSGRWGKWQSIGTSLRSSPAAAARPDGTLVVAAADGKRRVVVTTVADGKVTSAWRPSGLVSDSAPGLAVDRSDGSWHLVVRGPDAAAWHRVSKGGSGHWEPPVRIGGRLRSAPAVTSWGAGHLDLVAFGTDGRLVRSTFATGRWGDHQPVAPLTVPAKTRVVPDGTITAVAGDPAGAQTLTFAASATAPQPGDVLVSSVTAATPNGLLVKVVSARRGPDGSTTVTTRPAKLPEAIENANINIPIVLGEDDVAAGARSANARASSSSLRQTINRNVTCSGSVSATISGSVSITPRFDLAASWSIFGGVQSVSFTGSITEDAALTASIAGKASCTLASTALLPAPIQFRPIVFMVGPVPIVITPQLQLYLDANGSVEAAVTTGASQTATVGAGLRYSDGGVRPISQLSNTFTHLPPTVTATARAEAGISPRFSFLIYGLVGPRIDTRAHVRLDASPTSRPHWTVRAGLTAGVQLTIPQLDIQAGKSDVIRMDRVLARGDFTSTPPPPPPAQTRDITTTADGFESCDPGNKWRFSLSGVGGTTGISPPATITARTTTGSTVAIPLTSATEFGSAIYESGSTARLTGVATAAVDPRWNATTGRFTLVSGPCADTAVTLTASRATAQIGNQVTLSGRLTLANGAPVAGERVHIRWHSTSRDGKGQELGPFTTGPNGTFSTVVTVDEAGNHAFTAEYQGYGPLDRAHDRSSAQTTVRVGGAAS